MPLMTVRISLPAALVEKIYDDRDVVFPPSHKGVIYSFETVVSTLKDDRWLIIKRHGDSSFWGVMYDGFSGSRDHPWRVSAGDISLVMFERQEKITYAWVEVA